MFDRRASAAPARTSRSMRSALAVLALALPAFANAQQEPPDTRGPARGMAPIDLSGYWVSLVTDDWVFRMMTPVKGDYRFVPLNAEGRRLADSWDPARDQTAGEECKSYAAPAVMRLPTRLQIDWQDDDTLRIDIDNGTQTRLFHFSPAQPQGTPSWQGHSVAEWVFPSGSARGPARPDSPAAESQGGSLKVDTTHLRAGYLRKNGIPFSDDTFMTEYYSVLADENGSQYLLLQIFVDDPRYLDTHFVRTVQFKREPDGSKWSPTPCSAY